VNAIRLLRKDGRLATVLGFVLLCALGFGWLWTKAGGQIPLVAQYSDYQVSFVTGDVKNLREVRIAGVQVGVVESREPAEGGVRVTMSIDEEAAPLHDGAAVRVGVKSLVGASYVDVVDGHGPALPTGAEIPSQDVQPAVDIDELFATLNPPTRKSLRSAVRSLGQATEGTGKSLDTTMSGLGSVADEGAVALDAVARQGRDLERLTVEARQLLDALDTGRGQIATLVTDAERLTTATARKRAAVEATVRRLPPLVTSLRTGATKLRQLGVSVAPVARDLRAAAPDLNQALLRLPATTRDLNGLLPSLDTTLDRVPATLRRVPRFDASLRGLLPRTQTLLRDVNPMLAYLAPYGHDLGVLFANFGASFDTLAEDGIRPIRLTATAEGFASFRGNPVDYSNLTSLLWNNPYPAPGTVDQPQPWNGTYPRVHRDPE
jgi:phospholipid/cholesterol/gamma-HCH transport system substrate-binding protein